MMNMFWSFFVSSLTKEGIPEYVLRVYRSKFFQLPWQSFIPTLHNMQLMQEVCCFFSENLRFCPLKSSSQNAFLLHISTTFAVGDISKMFAGCKNI